MRTKEGNVARAEERENARTRITKLKVITRRGRRKEPWTGYFCAGTNSYNARRSIGTHDFRIFFLFFANNSLLPATGRRSREGGGEGRKNRREFVTSRMPHESGSDGEIRGRTVGLMSARVTPIEGERQRDCSSRIKFSLLQVFPQHPRASPA